MSYLLADAVAHFSNNTCTPDGANPADPLLFTCKVYEVVLLRVVLPTGDQEIISVGDTATDVALPDGFTVESLDIKEIDDFSRNFTLTLFITNASLLNDGGIMCDDTTTKKQAMAGCPTGKLSSPSNSSLLCYICTLWSSQLHYCNS